MVYVQTKDNQHDSLSFNVRETYKVRAGDQLSIKVSTTDPNTNALLNKEVTDHFYQLNPAAIFMHSYEVSDSGTIQLPIIGNFSVKNLTVEQISNSISTRLDSMLKIKDVSVKLSNFRISILGEVRQPGLQLIYSKHTSVFQALALAGDLTDFADRRKIKILRTKPDGKGADVFYLDITKPDCINSPYYFMQPDDVIYVTPAKPKITKANLAVYQAVLATVTAFYIFLKITEIR